MAKQRFPHLFRDKPALGAQRDPDFPHVRDVNAVWCRLYDSDVYDPGRNWRIENVAHNQYPFAEGYGVTEGGAYHSFTIRAGVCCEDQKVYVVTHDHYAVGRTVHIPWRKDALVTEGFLDTEEKIDAYAHIRDEAALNVVEYLDGLFRPDRVEEFLAKRAGLSN